MINCKGGGGNGQASFRERKKEKVITYNFSLILGRLNLVVPHTLGLHHMHLTMIPCHSIWSSWAPNHRATQSISDFQQFPTNDIPYSNIYDVHKLTASDTLG